MQRRKQHHNQIRVVGQRSLDSAFVFRSPNRKDSPTSNLEQNNANKGSSVSLSDFLDRKLTRNGPVPPKTVKGKSGQFSSPLSAVSNTIHKERRVGVEKEEKGSKSGIDQVILEQLKRDGVEKEDAVSSSVASDLQEVGTSELNETQGTRERKNPFSGSDVKHATCKRSLVLGDDTRPKQRVSTANSGSSKKPRPAYNHYANGCGWWDSDMEGIDSEEVGYGDLWEGVGSTTFGGIEWH